MVNNSASHYEGMPPVELRFRCRRVQCIPSHLSTSAWIIIPSSMATIE